jgi:hypothetical protein
MNLIRTSAISEQSLPAFAKNYVAVVPKNRISRNALHVGIGIYFRVWLNKALNGLGIGETDHYELKYSIDQRPILSIPC